MIMFSRLCKLCHKTTNVPFINSQRYYRRTFKKKSNTSPIVIPENIKNNTPIITCARKEFNFYEGQKYPKYTIIPLACKGWHHYKSKGDHFCIHPYAHLLEKNKDNACEEDNSFEQFDLDPQLIEILERYSITKPLHIQKVGIPKILKGANTVIAAETGCGKTLTYLLPMINEILKWKKLEENRKYNSPLGLIVTPSRELAFQIGLETKKICQYLNIRTRTFIGGKTKKTLLNPPVEDIDIIVASFGVISKLTTNKVIKLDMLKHIVLDEADALFHETFEEQLQVFLKKVPLGFTQNSTDKIPTAAQFTLASATMPSRMKTVLENIINVESLVSVSSNKLHHILVPQKFMRVGADEKPKELLKYIKPKIANKDQVIIFSNKSTTCNWVSVFLNSCNIKTVCLHGNMSFYDRNNKYATFKSGRCRILCTTNAGSRGLDTITVRHVLNYEFPTATADYIHRCGRTGRVGNIKDCKVTNFITTPADLTTLQKIERAVRKLKPIPIIDLHQTVEDDEKGFSLDELKDIDQIPVEEEFSIPF